MQDLQSKGFVGKRSLGGEELDGMIQYAALRDWTPFNFRIKERKVADAENPCVGSDGRNGVLGQIVLSKRWKLDIFLLML